MKLVLMSPEQKKVIVNTVTDPCLFKAPVNPVNTGTAYTRGTDLYAHKARSGKWYFYLDRWSMWQREDPQAELITKEAAEKYLLEKAGRSGVDSLGEKQAEALKEYGFDLLTEDA